jgi:choline kinase
VTRAVILAAGEGTRLRPLTADRPKCLVPLLGRPILEWQVDALRQAGVDEITVVTGYRAEQVEALGLPCVRNVRYDHTNMVESLMCARHLLDGRADVVVAYGDLVYEPRVVAALRASPAAIATTVDDSWRALWAERMDDPLADAETLVLDAEDHLVEIGNRPTGYEQIQAQYMGLIGIRADFAPRVTAAYDALDVAPAERDRMYMTTFLQHLVDHVHPVAAVRVEGGWLEVDTLEDLRVYEDLYARGRLDRYFAPPRG